MKHWNSKRPGTGNKKDTDGEKKSEDRRIPSREGKKNNNQLQLSREQFRNARQITTPIPLFVFNITV